MCFHVFNLKATTIAKRALFRFVYVLVLNEQREKTKHFFPVQILAVHNQAKHNKRFVYFLQLFFVASFIIFFSIFHALKSIYVVFIQEKKKTNGVFSSIIASANFMAFVSIVNVKRHSLCCVLVIRVASKQSFQLHHIHILFFHFFLYFVYKYPPNKCSSAKRQQKCNFHTLNIFVGAFLLNLPFF